MVGALKEKERLQRRSIGSHEMLMLTCVDRDGDGGLVINGSGEGRECSWWGWEFYGVKGNVNEKEGLEAFLGRKDTSTEAAPEATASLG